MDAAGCADVPVNLFVWHRGGKSSSLVLIKQMNKNTSMHLNFCEVLACFKLFLKYCMIMQV